MSETVEYRGYKINIHQDEWNDENPREWCNLGTLALNNNFWAEENISSTDELYENLLEHEEIRPWIAQDQDYCGYSIDHDKAQKNLEKKYIVLPVYRYEHGNVCYNTSGFSCPWDSGMNGFIYVSKEKVREEYGIKNISPAWVQKIKGYLENEVKTFSDAASGEVYGYHIENHEGEQLDSCYGFYGYDHEKSELLPQAKNAIDHEINGYKKYNVQHLKEMIINHVPLNSRVGELITIPA